MDHETRFLLASQISQRREVKDARRVFQKAKETAKERPKAVITDGLPAYIKAFKKEFFTLRNPRVTHIAKPTRTLGRNTFMLVSLLKELGNHA